jgi:FMN-dependent NADH-azoreductase
MKGVFIMYIDYIAKFGECYFVTQDELNSLLTNKKVLFDGYYEYGGFLAPVYVSATDDTAYTFITDIPYPYDSEE